MKIKVILLENIKGVGKKDEIVDVKDGYANNFLFPQKKAVLATAENINKLKMKSEKIEKNNERDLKKYNELKSQLDNKSINFKVKAGDNGKVFGSIGSKEIVKTIKEQLNIDLDKKYLSNCERLKSLGSHKLEIKFNANIIAILNINVIGE